MELWIEENMWIQNSKLYTTGEYKNKRESIEHTLDINELKTYTYNKILDDLLFWQVNLPLSIQFYIYFDTMYNSDEDLNYLNSKDEIILDIKKLLKAGSHEFAIHNENFELIDYII